MALKGIYIDGVKCLFAPEDILDGGIEPYEDTLTEYIEAWLEENYSDENVLKKDEDINVNNIVAGGDVTVIGNISAANFDPDTFTTYEAGENITFVEGEGTTTINAASAPELIAGSNITLTEDSENNQITIDATDTVYSLMTSAEATAGTSSAARLISPALLRSAIRDVFSISTKSNHGSVASKGHKQISIDPSRTGYTPIGVVGFASSSESCTVYGCRLNSGTVYADVFHPGVSSASSIDVTVTAFILYMKV